MADEIKSTQPAGSPPAAAKPKPKTKAEGTPLTDAARSKSEEGDIEQGQYTPEEKAEQIRPRLIAARDRRAYLIDQAEKNEAANDEVNAAETDVINEGRDKIVTFIDDDKAREEALASALAEVEQHTEKGAEKRAAARQAIADSRAERGDPTPVPGDITGKSQAKKAS